MPRKKLCRRICGAPGASYYKPQGIPLKDLEQVVLESDEFEALRLADGEGLYQELAASQMGISRQTLGLILKSARSKVVKAILQGAALRILKADSAQSFCGEEES